jgi:hypothetical protein
MSSAPKQLSSAMSEATLKLVWPTIGATRFGRTVGSLAGLRLPGDRFHVVGRMLAFATIPVSLAVYAWQLLPVVTRCYRLTNLRIQVLAGLSRVECGSVGLDDFDSIQIEVLPGQEWLRAGDLSFRREGQEVFRLPGVSRPEVFREVCLRARTALVSVRQVLSRQGA